MDSFTEIFETYKNMRGRSEIEVEISEVEPSLGSDIDDTVLYYKGYIDALKWVIEGE